VRPGSGYRVPNGRGLAQSRECPGQPGYKEPGHELEGDAVSEKVIAVGDVEQAVGAQQMVYQWHQDIGQA
jgi:hypothetical protein